MMFSKRPIFWWLRRKFLRLFKPPKSELLDAELRDQAMEKGISLAHGLEGMFNLNHPDSLKARFSKIELVQTQKEKHYRIIIEFDDPGTAPYRSVQDATEQFLKQAQLPDSYLVHIVCHRRRES